MISKAPESGVSPLLGKIYAAGLDESLWSEAIEQLRLDIGASSAALSSPEAPRRGGAFMVSRQHTIADAIEFHGYVSASPSLAAWKKMGRPVCEVFTLGLAGPREAFLKSDVYNGFFRPREIHDLAHSMLFNGLEGGHPITALSVHFPNPDWKLGNALPLFKSLVPHVKRALVLNELIAKQASERRAFLTVLGNLSIGVVVLSGRQQVLYANPAAEILFRGGDGLKIDAKELHAAPPSEDKKLQGCIVSAIGGSGLASAGSIRISRPSGKPAFEVTVFPVDPMESLFDDLNAASAVVTIVDLASRPRVPEAALKVRFGLTAAETRLLVKLAEGQSPIEIADQLEVSIRTVRMHLSHLLLKTDSRRQADLVRIALQARGI